MLYTVQYLISFSEMLDYCNAVTFLLTRLLLDPLMNSVCVVFSIRICSTALVRTVKTLSEATLNQ